MKGWPLRALRTVDRSLVGINREQGRFSLLAPFRKQATKGFLPIDWLATEVWSAAVAAT